MAAERSYTETTTYQHGYATVVVYRPMLDEKERKKREDNLCRAIALMGKEMQKNRKEGR